jgi:hypothetical protein
VLGKTSFDVARFVGKEKVIYEMSMEGGAADPSHQPRITLEISVLKYTGGPIVSHNGGAG